MNSQTKEESPTRPGPQTDDQTETKAEKKPNKCVSRELCHFLYFEDNDCFFPLRIDDRKRVSSSDEKMPSD
ncbi:uncharacterized protein TRUGW13939_03463 [Talaromyces rugulosus]|uniref:Uncharacterized protein n=1 Tax=Talaromyces rugulosus TaxID=121627 RepID=A0A7H8QR37_TALRU|nr:uncharacterized protein TRUGW13939_03463 [Talaromyces rugulosus]QKX56362.1 hypothetical protein TRUGW13939_03463 [Talaromyces rugulosus]